ncbi:asparagine synthase-domain-containing protein [Xylariomycetidae sp. FL2044]|nr:asparagine synthase-domain-containing protein [Xylariomycetidae sp. FL2044]
MCGIHARISTNGQVPISAALKQALCNRGPDHFGQTHRQIGSVAPDTRAVHLDFTSTVLALRGDHIAKQPLESPATDSVFCWNGEAWRIGGATVDGNDGEAIFAKLGDARAEARELDTLDVLRSIEGPFAFVYYDAEGKSLYFGRDRLGRRSLLWHSDADDSSLSFSSIADFPATGWEEVEADGIYSVDLDSFSFDILITDRIVKHPWLPSGSADTVSSIGTFNMSLPQPGHRLDFNSPSLSILRHFLTESLKLRVLNIPEPPHSGSDIDTRIAILFSGGLDCTLLARLAHELLPDNQGIDLINVAFENPRHVAIQKNQPHLQTPDVYEGCPDRSTGRRAFSELKDTCPDRYWRFIAVNVPFGDAMTHKSRVISLLHPHNTEMDLSIALALYFAARGIGECYIESSNWEPSRPLISTPARALLSGLGADELFGGYSRHEVAFKRGGYSSLIDELKLDVSRIGQRNLGRDDRIMTHWGKEVRFPYLDEEFVRFAISSPVEEKCDFENQFHPAVIDPAKRILRLLADQLGLKSTAREKKRAIQFGTRTAKLESSTGRLRGTAPITVPGQPNP